MRRIGPGSGIRAPKSKSISRLYFELTSEEYDEALEAVELSR